MPDTKRRSDMTHTGTGIAIGAGLGVLFGVILGGSFLPIGIAIGAGVGVAIGASLDAKEKK